MRVLHLLPSLQYNGVARRVVALAPRCVVAGCDVHVCCLGATGPWQRRLESAGVTVHVMNWTRSFDPTPWWRLSGLLKRLEPRCLHVWKPSALRTLGLVGRKYLPRVVFSRPWSQLGQRPGRLDGWLARRVGCIVTESDWEAQQCRDYGIDEDRLALIRPGIDGPASSGHVAPQLPRGRRIVCLGPVEKRKGFRDAIWAIDILAWIFPDLHLVIAGAGPELNYLRRFAGPIANPDKVTFMGPIADASALLTQADLCWAPTLSDGGGAAVLDALAAGCPVIASDVPALRDIVSHGETGFLIPPGDKVAIGRHTRTLLLDESLRRRLGQAGQQRVQTTFSAENSARRHQDVYGQVA